MISVVIPSYNQSKTLPEAIESVLDQSINCELIVVDDGSTDNSLEIARSYPIKVISQVNKGLASARNTGIMNALGDYILFLDADDLLLPDCIKRLEEVIKVTQADVVAPSFGEFGTSQRIVILQGFNFEDLKVANRLGYCAAIKKSVLQEVGGYSPRMTWGYEDYHLWFNLMSLRKSFAIIPEVLWMYRTKSDSMYSNALAHHEELMDQIKKDFLW